MFKIFSICVIRVAGGYDSQVADQVLTDVYLMDKKALALDSDSLSVDKISLVI